MSGTIDLIGGAHPLRQETIRMDVPEGETLEDMVRRVQPDPALWPLMRVWIDGHLILPGIYHRVKPKAGRQVVIKAWVGKGIIGALLSIVLTIVAPWAGGIIAGWAGFAATGFAAQLIGAGITLLGTLALQGLVKPPTLSAPERVEALPGLRGSRNELRRDGAVPVVLGRHLIAPLLGAEPYTENIGDDVYLRQLFVVGYGPLTIEDIKIGDTPIDRYEGVQIEVREGLPTDTPVTLYPDVAFQEPLSISVERNTWNARFTASDADLIYVDIEWPNGLVWFTDGGQKLLRRHIIEVEYRPAAGGAWVATAGIDIEENRQRTIRRTVSIPVSRGQYEVRVRRVDDPRYPDVETTNAQDTFVQDVVWTGLRTFRSEDPVQLGKPLALIALRIKATEQLNGVVDQLNCVATSRALAWNGSAWVMGPTSNPAALYRRLLQGPMVRRPVSDARLDLASLQDWAAKCDAAGREVNAVLTEKTTMFELIRDVAAVGRALPSMADGKYGVTLDEPQTVPRQMFTPRNIISASFERYYQDLPDGLRVRFRSAPALWSEDEVVVYNDGKTKANAVTFETLDIWGITDPQQAQYEGHYYFRAAKLRPESAQITTDVEGLVCRPGDMVRLAHDALLVGLAQGRIVGLTVDGSSNVTAIRLDAECVMVGGTNYGVVIRLPGGALEVARQVVTVAGAP